MCLYFHQAGEESEPIPQQTDEIPEELEDDVSEGTTILEEDIDDEEGEMRNGMVDIWTTVVVLTSQLFILLLIFFLNVMCALSNFSRKQKI